MGYKIGLPSLKLNNAGVKTKHCGSFAAVAKEALEERKGRDPDIDKERAHLNKYEGFRTAAELQEYSRQHVEQMRDARGRKLRSDAVVMCATLLKPPAAYMATLSSEDQQRFLDDSFNVFADIVGRENIKSRADHYDEQGAHSHLFWEPMTEDGRLCAKEIHNLKFFGRVNREIPAKLREKGWDIDDCEMYDAAKEEYEKEMAESEKHKANGRSSATYKAEAERQKRALEAQIDVLGETARRETEKAKKARQEAQNAIKERDEAIVKAEDAVKRAETAESRVQELENELQALDANIDDAFELYNNLNDDVVKLRAAVADPDELDDIDIKRGFNSVKLSPADAADKVIDSARGAAAAKYIVEKTNEHYEKMMKELEKANKEAAEWRAEQSKLMLKHAELEQQRQLLEKEKRQLTLALEQEKKKTSRLSDVLTSALDKLKNLLGNTGFGGWLADLFGGGRDPMLIGKTPEQIEEYLKQLEKDEREYIEMNYGKGR